MEDWKKRWERFMFTEDMIVGGGTVLNPKPETYSDFVRMLDDIENFISQELDRAREEVEDKFREKHKKREEEMNVPYSEEDGKDFWQGYQEGYHQGLKDMVIDTHYLDEEFQSKLTTK